MATTTSTDGSSPGLAGDPLEDDLLFGRSAVMADLRRRVQKIARADVPVLLQGNVGTGKESLARWIHAHSANAPGPFTKVSCAAIPGALLESELFGYERGAFTGAAVTKPGRVEQAQNGTLFLDEIADCHSSVQTKLLHFLQDGRFSRIGDHLERSVNARVICATNKDLAQEIDAGRFRLDLFYRISVVQLRLPSLEDRREDIALIAEHLRARYEKQFNKTSEPFAAAILERLQGQSWPGNIRELANSIARYVLVGPESILTPEQTLGHVPRRMAHSATPGQVLPLKRIAHQAIREVERRVILEALQANQWNRRRTAEALQISYRALIYKIRDAGLAPRRKAPDA